MINIDKKFIFTHPQKCGGMSIESALQRVLKLDWDTHEANLNRHAPLSKELEIARTQAPNTEFFKFSVIRNPWDRMVSLYYMLQTFERPRANHYLANTPIDELRYYKKMRPMNFSEFCEFHHTQDFQRIDSTKKFFYDNGEYKIDFVIRFENIQNDFNHCLHRLELEEIQLPHIRLGTGRTKKDYREYYNDTAKKIVERHFAFDIDFFKYTF